MPQALRVACVIFLKVSTVFFPQLEEMNLHSFLCKISTLKKNREKRTVSVVNELERSFMHESQLEVVISGKRRVREGRGSTKVSPCKILSNLLGAKHEDKNVLSVYCNSKSPLLHSPVNTSLTALGWSNKH